MKCTRLAILATTAVFTWTYSAGASSTFPLVRLNISGIVSYNADSPVDDGTITKSRLTTVTITTKSLIDLLNASPAVVATLVDVTGTNQIPTRSCFVYDLDNQNLIVRNNNGFSFTLRGYDSVSGSYYDYGHLNICADNLIGRYIQEDANGSGNEWDITGIEFSFDDSNGNSFSDYGNGTIGWVFGRVSGGVQKTTLNIDFPAPNGYNDTVNYNKAIARNVSFSGRAVGEVRSGIFPFYLWW
jgi:hypothetical protein